MAADDYFCKYCALESQGFDDEQLTQSLELNEKIAEICPSCVEDDTEFQKSQYICKRHRSNAFKISSGKSREINFTGFRLEQNENSTGSEFPHNISNTQGRYLHKSGEKAVYQRNGNSKSLSPKSFTEEHDKGDARKFGKTQAMACVMMKSNTSAIGNRPCNCANFHQHTFNTPDFYIPPEESTSQLDLTLPLNHPDVELANEVYLNISNTFWYPSLCLNEFSPEFEYTNFESLWPQENALRDILRDSIQNTVLRSAIPQLTKVAIVCGPIDMLKSLISLSLLRLDSIIDEEAGLLHYACLFRRIDIITYLTALGISPKLKDKHGALAYDVCFSSKVYKQLPSRYQSSQSKPAQKQPSTQDINVIFSLAKSPKCLYDLQRKLQMLEFNVNTECDENGNFLIHLITQIGLCQLPLIYCLRHIQHADIELCNSDGLTPLMIAAKEGSNILCDVLMCIFGADPNKCNVHNGKVALHYATKNNHVNVISTLIKRGADFNKEDYEGRRPDDLISSPRYHKDLHGDCQDIISSQRLQRLKQLSNTILNGTLKKGELWKSDISVTDENNLTLVMLAASHNRLENLKILLEVSTDSINAQYYKLYSDLEDDELFTTGMTALSIAAVKGHADIIKLLLWKGAKPVIADMNGWYPLHHSVHHNREEAVTALLQFFPVAYWGLYGAMKMSKKTAIHNIVKQAWQRRQEEVVSMGLFESCMSGKADKLYCMLEEGDNLDTKSGVGNWPLYLAVENGHLDVVKLLCQRGADIRKRHTPTGSTLLHIAAKMGRLEVMDYLLELCRPLKKNNIEYKYGYFHRGLDVNSMNIENKTPLQEAAEKGFLKIVKSLLLHGATTSVLDSNGALFCLPEYGGVWHEINNQRQRHTNHIFNFIMEKSKKSFKALMKIWMPGFDHNLRDKFGNTPLMVACQCSQQEVISFLLQSAVYPQSGQEDDDTISTYDDNDSGVQDATMPQSFRKPPASYRDDDLLHSIELSQDYGQDLGIFRFEQNRTPPSRVETLLNDVEKSKGLSIFHDGLVSHVCAVNLADGCTALHMTVLKGDNSSVVGLLLEADPTCVNMQDNAGLTPLHHACRLKRKKCVESLLSVEEVDVNILSLNGDLAEDLTSDKSLIKLIHHHRKGQPVRQKVPIASSASSVVDISLQSAPSTPKASTVNFEKVQSRFEALKRQKKI